MGSLARAKGCRGVCSICKLQGRAGRVKWRSVNAPLAYLMGGIRTVGFEGWVGFFFMFPIDKHCFSCSSSHGEELIAFPPSLPLHPSAGWCRWSRCWCFAGAGMGTCPSTSQSSRAHITPASHPEFWGEIALYSHLQARSEGNYPHYLSRPDPFSLPVVLCFLGAMTLVYSKERAPSEPSTIYLEERLLFRKKTFKRKQILRAVNHSVSLYLELTYPLMLDRHIWGFLDFSRDCLFVDSPGLLTALPIQVGPVLWCLTPNCGSAAVSVWLGSWN